VRKEDLAQITGIGRASRMIHSIVMLRAGKSFPIGVV
jgi:hypothetical protein